MLLSIPKDYFNEFIDYCYSNLGDFAKLSINSMVGMFKPKPREVWKTKKIVTNMNEAFNELLLDESSFIDIRTIGADKKVWYQVYNKYISSRNETDFLFYKQILEEEAIELYKIRELVEKNGGFVLDLKTDAVICVFKNDVFPFELEDGFNIAGHYHDDDKKVHKYKLEDKEIARLKVELLPQYVRTAKYEFKNKDWNNVPDVEDNNVKSLVDKILDSNQSWNIDGLAGTGKTYFTNKIQDEMNVRKIEYISVAPTNKACIKLQKGRTIDSFFRQINNRRSVQNFKADYIIIDEVSMMSENFYKLFLFLKQAHPHLKFILVGNFDQLEPVNDRVQHVDYSNSQAIKELCDFNKINLTTCRRADETFFNMIHPNNIPNLKKQHFNNTYAERHLCFTNEKRKQINKEMMDYWIKKIIAKADESQTKRPSIKKISKVETIENSQDVKLIEGMPILARKNFFIDDKHIANNEGFIIQKIDLENEDILIKSDCCEDYYTIKFDEFQRCFCVAFCLTVHKSQGETYKFPYTIHEWNRYTNKMKYVALSRSTSIEFINIV